MKPVRIIPRLDVKGANLVKGVHLEGLRVLGVPERFSEYYFQEEADELLYMDTVASLYGRNNLEDIVRRTAENVFVPITVGGGIRSVEDIRRLLRAGADKVAINTAAVKNPGLIAEGARIFGSQCIVVSIEAIETSKGKYEAYTDNGRERTGRDAVEWAVEAVKHGAGEILVTSIDREGTGLGYDLGLITRVVEAVPVPVIACGGAGCAGHVEEVARKCRVDAVSAASIFHYHAVEHFGVEKRDEGNVEYLKEFVERKGIILKNFTPLSIPSLKDALAGAGIPCVFSRKIDSIEKRDSETPESAVHPGHGKRRSRVTVVDYGGSNLFSVEHALRQVGGEVEVTSDPDRVLAAERLLIAGVGAFGDGMEGLRSRDLLEPIRECARRGTPILGICLGMQLFMEEGEEFGDHKGLGLIKGRCVRLRESDGSGDRIRIPHIGWNRIFPPHSGNGESAGGEGWEADPLLDGLLSGDFMYFVHSFVISPEEQSIVLAESRHGPNRFCSVLRKGSIMGCQFHPERSGPRGLQIYRNFINPFERG